MTASTPNGWPYVEPTDLPVQFPTHSQNLANLLEQRVGMAPAGGVMNFATNVASSPSANTPLALNGNLSTVWGACAISGNSLMLQAAGLWRISFNVSIANNAAGTIRAAWVWLNSGDGLPVGWVPISSVMLPVSPTTGTGNGLSAVGVWRMPANDGLRLIARQDSGATLLVNGTLVAQFIRP